MLGLVSLEVYNSLLNITEENNKFELYTYDSDNEFSFVELKDKVAEVLGLSNITDEELEHEVHGPDNIKTYRKLSIEKSQTDGYYIVVNDYRHSLLEILKVILEF